MKPRTPMLMDQLVGLGIPQEVIDIWKREEGQTLLPVQELAVTEGVLTRSRSEIRSQGCCQARLGSVGMV